MLKLFTHGVCGAKITMAFRLLSESWHVCSVAPLMEMCAPFLPGPPILQLLVVPKLPCATMMLSQVMVLPLVLPMVSVPSTAKLRSSG
jgi:hypothetical protein